MVNPSDAMKVPPHDSEAEKSVLGAILIDSSAINLIAEFLKPEHFYLVEHQAIFSSMLVSGVCKNLMSSLVFSDAFFM